MPTTRCSRAAHYIISRDKWTANRLTDSRSKSLPLGGLVGASAVTTSAAGRASNRDFMRSSSRLDSWLAMRKYVLALTLRLARTLAAFYVVQGLGLKKLATVALGVASAVGSSACSRISICMRQTSD